MNFSPMASNLLCEAHMAVTPEQLYEQTLVVRSQIGDEAAFAELLALYGPRLLLFAERMMQSSPESIGDVMQETWIAIFRGLPGLKDITKFRPWAFRIARDRIYREFRRRKLPAEPLNEIHLDTVSVSVDDDSGIDPEELHRCLNVLAPEQREALVLRFFEEMSYEEIARVTDASIGTIRSRIHYGKRALRNAWESKNI
jgi:RNA polymerase sigma-70 factor, ECF subfamily